MVRLAKPVDVGAVEFDAVPDPPAPAVGKGDDKGMGKGLEPVPVVAKAAKAQGKGKGKGKAGPVVAQAAKAGKGKGKAGPVVAQAAKAQGKGKGKGKAGPVVAQAAKAGKGKGKAGPVVAQAAKAGPVVAADDPVAKAKAAGPVGVAKAAAKAGPVVPVVQAAGPVVAKGKGKGQEMDEHPENEHLQIAKKCRLCQVSFGNETTFSGGRCPACNSSRTRLYKEGSWCEVAALKPDDVAKFFAETAGMSTHATLQKLAEYRVTNDTSHHEVDESRGRFLPLSVWGKRGFDPELIRDEAGPGDVKRIKQLGLCYRAVLPEDLIKDDRSWRTSEAYNSSPPAKAPRTETPEEVKARLVEEKRLKKIQDLHETTLSDKIIKPLTDAMAKVPPMLQTPIRQYISMFNEAVAGIKNAGSVEQVLNVVNACASDVQICKQMIKGFKSL